MKEYIEKAAALDICQKEYEERLRMADYYGDTVAWNIGGAIKNTPAADVAPVRHGRWEKFSTASGIISRVRCSVCSGTQPLTFESMPYCPNCGALMREIENGFD